MRHRFFGGLSTGLRQRVVLGWAVVALGSLLGAWDEQGGRHTARAAEASPKPAPRCALIVLDPSPLAALVETKLLEGAGGHWLERAELDKVLKEQELQSLLGAQAGQGRTRLGRLLKAEVLVFLRTGEKAVPGEPRKVRYAEIVVSDTDRGVRWLAQTVPLSDNGEADAARLSEIAGAAIGKHGRQVRDIYAVPPFVSQDLTYDHDYLKAAFAKLVEQSLLEQPGVVVVELAEADTLARESKLAGEDPKFVRQLPRYVLGEYRTQRSGDAVQVALRAKVQQGEQVLQTTERTLRLDKAPPFLLEAAAQWARRDNAAKVFDPAAEARQLASRAKDFLKLGNGAEALPLIETSLMLRPEQPEAHCDAIAALRRMPLAGAPEELRTYLDGMNRRLRGLHHLESLVRTNEDVEKSVSWEEILFLFPPMRRPVVLGLPEEAQSLRDRVDQLEQRLALELADRHARKANWQQSAHYLRAALRNLGAKRRFEETAKLVRKYQGSSNVAAMTASYAHGGYTVERLDSAEGRGFLDRLSSSDEFNAEVHKAAAGIKRALDAAVEKRGKRSGTSPKPGEEQATGELHLGFEPLALEVVDAGGGRKKLPFLQAWIAAEGFDIVASDFLGVMKRPGIVQPLWSGPPGMGGLGNVRYDGRYVWAVVSSRSEPPKLLVADPGAGQVREVTQKDGLPVVAPTDAAGTPISQRVILSPVAPGKACIVGAFGRTWIAIVTIGSEGRPKVEVLHEAREVAAAKDGQTAWKNTSVAFAPGDIRTVSSPPGAAGTPEQRIVVSRNETSILHGHSLIVDPQRRSVVADPGYWWDSKDGATYQGALYAVLPDPASPSDRLSLCKIAPPNLHRVPVIPDVKEGIVAFAGDRVHVVGKQWWTGKLSDGRLACAGKVPWVYFNHWGASGPDTHPVPLRLEEYRLAFLAPSVHYGLVACYYNDRRDRPESCVMARVVLDQGSSRPSSSTPAAQDAASPDTLAARFVPPSFEEADRRLWRTSLRRGAPAACSPTGRLAATASPVQFWDARDGKYLGRVAAQGEFTAIAFSHHGRWLAAGAADGTVLLWSVPERRPRWASTGHRARLLALQFSPDGKHLASVAADSKLRLWDVETGQPVHELTTAHNDYRRLAFSPDGSLVATSGNGGTQFLRVETGQPDHVSETLADLAGFLPDGTALGMSDDLPRNAIAWDPRTHEARKWFPEALGQSVALSPDGKYLVTRGASIVRGDKIERSAHLFVWDVAAQREIGPGVDADGACFTADGARLLILRTDGGVRLWDIAGRCDVTPIDAPKAAR